MRQTKIRLILFLIRKLFTNSNLVVLFSLFFFLNVISFAIILVVFHSDLDINKIMLETKSSHVIYNIIMYNISSSIVSESRTP